MKENSSLPLPPPPPRYKSTTNESKVSVGCHKEDTALHSCVAAEDLPTQKLESRPSMDINESAEAFIKKFRQQLLIQRLESLENFEQMLARGQ
ncbi:hypothetical protein K2173_017257 [Erythroxylum novogranatense]|uniref:Uncharacterized protein n=1 Tax=Erythroxylum novogranatense TaxID=1862640 RepID=A0AAV8U7E1_9ROSI|nr:hypothetical protein K2173_017257 [Erythroxylum novogranatense]